MSCEAIVTVKFRERGTTGPVFHVLIVQQEQVPQQKDVKVEELVLLSKKVASGMRRIFWSTSGVDAEVSQLQKKWGVSKIINFDCSSFYSNGQPATYIERGRQRPIVASMTLE